MESDEFLVRKRKRDDDEEQDAAGPREATDQHGGENRNTEDETSPAESSEDAGAVLFSSHSSSTHDTTASSFHFSSIHDFTRDLQSAVEASWKTRHDSSTRSKYKAVRALLVSWEEDDLGVVAELDVLGQLLEDAYRYDVRKWKIPSMDSFKALDGYIRSVTEDIWGAAPSLFILFYAGHARPSRDLGSFPRWASRRFGGKEVNPLSIQVYLENAECDVLFLYDCCHSIHTGGGDSYSGGVKEAMAAGGFETIAANVGEHSFTYLLTHQLARAAAQSQAISVSDIHGYLLAGLGNYTRRLLMDNCGKLALDDNKRPRFEPPVRRTPIHYFLSQKHASIIFAPLLKDDSSSKIPMMPPPPLQEPHPKAAAGTEFGPRKTIRKIKSMPNWTCAPPDRAGFICPTTLSDFSSDSNGAALEDASARLEPSPDIAGKGIFIAFSLAFLFSSVLAFLIHACEASEIHKTSKNRICKRERHSWLKSTHHVLDRILIAWSDQQLILGLATSIAVIVEWCSFSSYHLNIIKQWLIFCSATHVNALLVHCGYFCAKHIPANILRVALITVHTVLASIIMFNSGQAGNWSPTVGDYTPLQALPHPCFFVNASRSDTLEKVVGWGSHGLRGDYLFVASAILLLVALLSLFGDLFHFWTRAANSKRIRSRPLNFKSYHKQWMHWIYRLILLVANLGIGATVFDYTLRLRSYMVDSKWLIDASEHDVTYGQYVPICLAGLVLFSALQGLADEIDNKQLTRGKGQP